MRIGNNYPPPVPPSDRPVAARGQQAQKPLQNTTDLIAMSEATTGGPFSLHAGDAAREARVQQLTEAWRSGAYRPDPQRIAGKLLQWGFDGGPVQS